MGRLVVTDLYQHFRNHPFTATMSDGHIATLESCGAAVVSFEQGEKIVREGEVTDACFFIDDGDVALDLYVGGAESRTVRTVHGGEIVGWSWLMSPYRGAFDATALTPVIALRVDAALLREAMDRDKGFGYEMMKRFCDVIVDRLRALRLRFFDMYGLPEGDIAQRQRVGTGHRVGR
jgi:CRP/FNR family cyclic AMP-dependent transcriptional regulator